MAAERITNVYPARHFNRGKLLTFIQTPQGATPKRLCRETVVFCLPGVLPGVTPLSTRVDERLIETLHVAPKFIRFRGQVAAVRILAHASPG